jgi:hypothetical protein
MRETDKKIDNFYPFNPKDFNLKNMESINKVKKFHLKKNKKNNLL